MNFKFCPKCGGKLKKIKQENRQRLACSTCHFIFYGNAKPTVGVVIVDEEGRILLAKRGIEPKKNFWDLPGGFLEENEHPEDGLKRELQEELGVKIKIDKMLDIFIDDYEDQDDICFTLNIYYLAKIIQGEPKPMSDISDLQWFEKENLPLDKMAFKNGREALKLWLKK